MRSLLTRTQRNLFANIAGQGGTALGGLLFLPVHLSFLGIEAYGLVGFFASLQLALTVFDLGLSLAANREFARLSADPGAAAELRRLARGLQRLYWAVGIALGAALAALAPAVATHWLRLDHLDPAAATRAVVLMGAVVASHWPLAFYAGAVGGLQRQVHLNLITLAAALLRFPGSALVLWRVSPTVEAFFAWQLLTSAVQTGLTAALLWRSLPPAAGPGPAPAWGRLGRFASGVGAIAAAGLVLMQLDKVLLSTLLPLDQFGHYTLAQNAAGGLLVLGAPVFAALYPRFAQLAAGPGDGVRPLFHAGCQLLAVLVVPAAAVMTAFPAEVLLAWTGNPAVAGPAAASLRWLAVGNALNGFVTVPYAVQLGYGWTRLALVANVVAVVLLGPLIVVAAGARGGPGTAFVWMLVNAGFVLFATPVMFRRLPLGGYGRWLAGDVVRPAAVPLVVACLARLLVPEDLSRVAAAGVVVGVSGVGFVAAVLTTPVTREWVARWVRRRG